MARWGPPHGLPKEGEGALTRPASAPAAGTDTSRGPREGNALSRLGRVPRLHAVDVRRRVRNVGDDLRKQLEQSWCEVNLAPLTVDELVVLADALSAEGYHLQALRLVAESRGNFLLSSRAHRSIVAHVSGSMRAHRVAKALPKAIALSALASEQLTDLELGAGFAADGMRVIGNAIGLNQTLQRVSFAGACLGDTGMLALHRGLAKNTSMEELILSGCQLTDKSGPLVAGVVKAHAATRSLKEWRKTLRQYPNNGAQAITVDGDYDENDDVDVGGLLLLDISDNLITDKGAKHILDALALDVNLLILSLRSNRLTHETEARVQEALGSHPRLTRVDLRGNIDFMGVARGASAAAQESAQRLAVARAFEAATSASAVAAAAGRPPPAARNAHAVENVPRDAAILELADENRTLRHQLRQLTETAGKLFSLAETRGLGGAVAPPPRRPGGGSRITVDSRQRTRARAGVPAVQTKAMRSAEVDLVGKLTRALRRLEHVVDGFAASSADAPTPSRVAHMGSPARGASAAWSDVPPAGKAPRTPASVRGADAPIRGDVMREIAAVHGIVDGDDADA